MGPDCDNASQEEAMSIVADRSEAPVLEDSEPLLCVEEAAKLLKLAPKWLYERTRKNAISHHVSASTYDSPSLICTKSSSGALAAHRI